MKVGQIGPTFVDPGKTVSFWRVKSVVSFSTLKMRKSKKKLAPVYAYTHVYARKRDGGDHLTYQMVVTLSTCTGNILKTPGGWVPTPRVAPQISLKLTSIRTPPHWRLGHGSLSNHCQSPLMLFASSSSLLAPGLLVHQRLYSSPEFQQIHLRQGTRTGSRK